MMSFEPADLQRINLVGTSGSGKSTTGRRLAEILKSPYIEMDVLYHGPNWTQAQPEVFRARVAGAIAGPRWVLDGNYHRTSDLKWARATMIVWLDIAWVPNMYRAVGRAVRRSWTRTDSMILWTATTHHQLRRRYSQVEQSPPEGVKFIRPRSIRGVEQFLETVRSIKAA